MKKQEIKYANGFTLIELLVVVLIIGILAAIALPQYQKAVLKSRFAALKPLAKAVKNAQEIYYNEHGKYATYLAALDIQPPSEAELELSNTTGHEYIRATKSNLNNRYTAYFDHSENFAGNIYCEALTADAQALAVCESEGGTVGPTNGNYTLYLLSGSSAGSFGLEPPQHTAGANTHWSASDCSHANIGCNTYTYNDGTVVETWEDNERIDVYVTNGDTSEMFTYCSPLVCGGEEVLQLIDFCQKYSGIETVGRYSCSEL